MSLNKGVFFREIRISLFRGKMNKSQVEGLETLLDIWFKDYAEHPLEHLAYCLGTAYHEVGGRMQPVREGFKDTDAESIAHVRMLKRRGKIRRNYAKIDPKTGHSYFGRGIVQITHAYNYKRMSKRLGIDFYNNPDKALEVEHSAHILFAGCLEGMFTGVRLGDYITETKTNYRSARLVVNGMDKASKIARYAEKFEFALEEAESDEVTERKLENAGSKTIKSTKSNDDAGKAVIGVGVGSGIAEAVTSYKDQLKEASESLSEYRTIADAFIDFFVWAASYWWVFALAAGGLVLWNNKQIIKARLSDEHKIGRLADD